jgi:hypothetical protein
VVTACSSVVVGKAAGQALAMVERMEAEGGTVDMVAVWNTASRASSDAATRWELTAIIACWVVGVVDAYLAGRKADQAGQMQR